MFYDLHKGDASLFSLNFEVITLIPKVQDANRVQTYLFAQRELQNIN
jgi:hypothetical protein